MSNSQCFLLLELQALLSDLIESSLWTMTCEGGNAGRQVEGLSCCQTLPEAGALLDSLPSLPPVLTTTLKIVHVLRAFFVTVVMMDHSLCIIAFNSSNISKMIIISSLE